MVLRGGLGFGRDPTLKGEPGPTGVSARLLGWLAGETEGFVAIGIGGEGWPVGFHAALEEGMLIGPVGREELFTPGVADAVGG